MQLLSNSVGEKLSPVAEYRRKAAEIVRFRFRYGFCPRGYWMLFKTALGGRDVENSELAVKLEQWLNNVSAALHRLSREREVLRETRTQIMMGVLSAQQAEANLARLTQWDDGDYNGLSTDVVVRLRHAGL